MFFKLKNRNKTIKELRKARSYTAKQLADKTRLEVNDILAIDSTPLKQVPKPIKEKILPLLRGDDTDHVPW